MFEPNGKKYRFSSATITSTPQNSKPMKKIKITILRWICVLFLLQTYSQAKTAANKISTIMVKAYNSNDAGEYDQTIRLYKQALKIDKKIAMQWIKENAKNDDYIAMCLLSYMYANGVITKKNPKKAKELMDAIKEEDDEDINEVLSRCKP